MSIKNRVNGIIDEMVARGKTEGLTIDDYKTLQALQKELIHELGDDCFCDTVYSRIDRLSYLFYDSGMLHRFSRNNINYIYENTYVLPLALANSGITNSDNVKITGDNRYMFLCNMHVEKTPSMGVYDIANYFYCFGCHSSGGVVQYLMSVEDLSYKDALELLSQIYLLNVPNPDRKMLELACSYREKIINSSELYKKLLEKGMERLVARHKTEIDFKNVDTEYDRRLKTISRIVSGERDPEFVYENPLKLVKKIIIK